MKKKCGCCQIEKSISEFYHWKNKVRNWCKDCDRKYTILKQWRFKEKCVEYKGGKCEKCGYNKYTGALEFHHKNPSKKEFGIASAKFKQFDEKIKSELNKCELLCSNCHRESHQVHNKNELEIFFNKPKKQRKKYFCNCGNEKSRRSTGCKNCQNKNALNRSVEEVISKVKEFNWVQAGKYFGVSDNALRKFLRLRGIDIKSLKPLDKTL